MLYLLDTANVNKIRKAYESYPIDGVTTNPTIISKEKTDFVTLIKEIRGIIGRDGMIHIQTTKIDTEGIIKEAIALRDFVNGNFYIKIPTIKFCAKVIHYFLKPNYFCIFYYSSIFFLPDKFNN